MSIDKREHLPDAIYLDANNLRSAGINLDKQWIAELASFTKEFGILLCIPELVLEEWCKYIFDQLESSRQKLDSAINFLGDYNVAVPVYDKKFLILPNRDQLKQIVKERLINFGFEIIPNWNGNMEELIGEAIRKIAPFDDKGKGFCDTIIVESSILHAINTFENPRVTVISNDEV